MNAPNKALLSLRSPSKSSFTLGKLRFFGFRKPKNSSCYTRSGVGRLEIQDSKFKIIKGRVALFYIIPSFHIFASIAVGDNTTLYAKMLKSTA